jgi:hypothetical protein
MLNQAVETTDLLQRRAYISYSNRKQKPAHWAPNLVTLKILGRIAHSGKRIANSVAVFGKERSATA